MHNVAPLYKNSNERRKAEKFNNGAPVFSTITVCAFDVHATKFTQFFNLKNPIDNQIFRN